MYIYIFKAKNPKLFLKVKLFKVLSVRYKKKDCNKENLYLLMKICTCNLKNIY